MKKLSILGSTGSIGTQATEVVSSQEDVKIVALSANSNVDLLAEQTRRFNPEIICICDKSKYNELKILLSDTNVKIYCGEEYLSEVSAYDNADMILTSVVGNVGLKPTVDAIKARKKILLANKETLVTGGEFIMPLTREYGVDIVPVDSEHCAIHQCLKSGKKEELYKILLTCSGGPFRGSSKESLQGIKASDALKHPNWNMGAKITIDSATLMNKGLEVIEAKWLFDVNVEDIEVYVHPQSIVHSMVEFKDGSVIAQLGNPDMRLPIQYAINYPDRLCRIGDRLDLFKIASLTFEKPDRDTFSCLNIAYNAIEAGGIMPTVMNAANEIAVAAFLNDKISFVDIPAVIVETMSNFSNSAATLDTVVENDHYARICAGEIIGRI